MARGASSQARSGSRGPGSVPAATAWSWRVPLVRRNMAAAAAAGVAFAQAAAIGIWNRLVRTVHAIAARLGPAVEATVARVPLVRRNMAAAAAAGVAFAQAAAIGIWNRLVRTVHAIAARLRPAVEATVARVPLVRRSMAAAAAAGVAFAQAAAIGIRNRLVRTVHAIAARLRPAVEATVARVPLVRRSMAAAAAAGVAFAQATALGIRNRLVRTVHAIAARLGAGVEATVARIPLARRSMAAAGVAFARAVVLGIRDGLVGTVQAVAAGLGAGVQAVAARVTLARRSMAAPAAAGVAFAQAAALGIRSRLVRTVHAIAARFGAGVEATVARVRLVRRSMAPAAAAVVATAEPAVAIGIPNAASRTTRALAHGIGTAVHAAIARIGIVGVTAVDKARRGTASAMAFLRTSSAPAKRGRCLVRADPDARHPARRGPHHGSRGIRARRVRASRAPRRLAPGGDRRPRGPRSRGAGTVGRRSPSAGPRPGNRRSRRTRLHSSDPPRVSGPLRARQRRATAGRNRQRRSRGESDACWCAGLGTAAAHRAGARGHPQPDDRPVRGRVVVVAVDATGARRGPSAAQRTPRQPPDSPSPIAAVASPVAQATPSRSLSPALVRAIWAKSDTRSLDLAFGALRSAPLALHRCDLLQTSANRAVAHCDEIPEGGAAASPQHRVTWTIKFRRVDDGWVIEDVSTSRPRARARRNR